MKGIILGIDTTTNTGVITGDDGKRYNFTGATWQEQTAPIKGAEVVFDASDNHEANNVYFARNVTDANPFAPPTTNLIKDNHNAVSSAILEEESYTIIDWFKKCLRNYANFSGRARRKEYWYFTLCQFGITIIAMIIDAVLFSDNPILYTLCALALLIPNLAVTARRLHDINRSGWWMLVSLIPILGSILLIVWLATDTKPEMNEWGAPAR